MTLQPTRLYNERVSIWLGLHDRDLKNVGTGNFEIWHGETDADAAVELSCEVAVTEINPEHALELTEIAQMAAGGRALCRLRVEAKGGTSGDLKYFEGEMAFDRYDHIGNERISEQATVVRDGTLLHGQKSLSTDNFRLEGFA